MLRAVNLQCQRDERVLFSNLTFEVSAGSFLSVSGANGSGKSSLLKTLTGLLIPTAGSVLWDGCVLKPGDPVYLSKLLYIGHKTGLHPTLSPIENLKWLSFGTGTIEAALEEVGLKGLGDVPCELLSKGQCQRVALARLWLQQAKLWILDEPFASLDAGGQQLLQDKFISHLKKGGILVVAGHQTLSFSSFSNGVSIVMGKSNG